ncbi:hypothetical protein AAG747_03765 [Rapidithrix thailandica]|uniref:Tetratricopeptide repeat protein n=1 Tax=Rapidithrix thailandica TaxID=413964 RepID=A0AAW9S6M6_9BACT
MKELPDHIYGPVQQLSEQGEQLVDNDQLEKAKQKYIEALKLLPLPHADWEAATWLYAAMGDVHYYLGNFEDMMKSFANAVQCPGGLGNPFIHLRLGQAFYELGFIEKAADELSRAYMGAGEEIFAEEDPKYISFLATKIYMKKMKAS